MRGPGYKLTLDVRRLWRCAACGYERRADGRATTVRCQCASNPFMHLVGEPRFLRTPNRPLDLYIRAEDVLGPEDILPTLPPAVDESSPPAASDESRPATPAPRTESWTPDAPNQNQPPSEVVAEVPDRSTDELVTAADGPKATDGASTQPSTESPATGGGSRSRNRRRHRGRGGPKPPHGGESG